MNSTEPKSLLEEPSPNGNIVAIVEEEANTCYYKSLVDNPN